jgi:hypothetical protein
MATALEVRMRPVSTPLLSPSARDRFWEKVQKTDGCWLWTATLMRGYGWFRVGSRPHYAHRIAWQEAYGPIPEGRLVLHHCDVRACVNYVDHLFLGSNDDNMLDKARKGHAVKKLDEALVRAIRARYAAGGVSQYRLAAEYGLHQVTISEIVLRKTWDWLT